METARYNDAMDPVGQLDRLERLGAECLRGVPGKHLAEAWWSATNDLPRQLPADLRSSMAEAARLSPEGLEAGLCVVVRGVRTEAARNLLLNTPPPNERLRPAFVVLASNLPGLALQCLLPALAARRPVFLKTPSAEPDFTPWFLRRLEAVAPEIRDAVATATWRGGVRGIEDPILARVGRVIAYGGDGAIADLGGRATGSFTGQGHRISLGIVPSTSGIELATTARGLARDVALFDQQGCLSIHSVLVTDSSAPDHIEGLASDLADALAEQLIALAKDLPPGPARVDQLAAVRAAREEAVMAGHRAIDLPLRLGTVLLERIDEDQEPRRLESPGLRTVRIVPVRSRTAVWKLLRSWRGRLQGIALGHRDGAFETGLRELGVTRIASPGQLQDVDAAVWHNGGDSPLANFEDSSAE
ncbi:MAG: hypothetical protein MPN21_08700 [Thermoanaerobaculia bacterium]|nr:hypothetical protein [Thermoanaerobaculia bacterium]